MHQKPGQHCSRVKQSHCQSCYSLQNVEVLCNDTAGIRSAAPLHGIETARTWMTLPSSSSFLCPMCSMCFFRFRNIFSNLRVLVAVRPIGFKWYLCTTRFQFSTQRAGTDYVASTRVSFHKSARHTTTFAVCCQVLMQTDKYGPHCTNISPTLRPRGTLLAH